MKVLLPDCQVNGECISSLFHYVTRAHLSEPYLFGRAALPLHVVKTMLCSLFDPLYLSSLRTKQLVAISFIIITRFYFRLRNNAHSTSTKQRTLKKEAIYLTEIAHHNAVLLPLPARLQATTQPKQTTPPARVTLPASGTLYSSSTFNIQGTINPQLLRITDNMSDQTNLPQQSTQGQDALQQFGVTQEEVSDFQQGDPQLGDYDFDNDMMLGVETGFVGFPDIPADQMFTDAPQTQEAQQGQPPNTEGPCYNPKVQWHYLSTLPAGVQPLEYSDMNFDGPYYAPSTGWYFKMLNPPGAQLMPPMPFPGVQEGYTPSPYSSVVLSGVVTPIAPPSHVRVPPAAPTRPQKLSTPKVRPVRKQKYGPQAYLRHKRRAQSQLPHALHHYPKLTTPQPLTAGTINPATYRRQLAFASRISIPASFKPASAPTKPQTRSSGQEMHSFCIALHGRRRS